jgi:hypothetical protein
MNAAIIKSMIVYRNGSDMEGTNNIMKKNGLGSLKSKRT